MSTAREQVCIRTSGKHGSIGEIVWDDVPAFAVLTGTNGAGKTQFLEVLASSHGIPLLPEQQEIGEIPATLSAIGRFEGVEYGHGEVFHSYGDWPSLDARPASEADVFAAIQKLPRYSSAYEKGQWWEEKLAESTGNSVEQIRSLSLEDIHPLLTPGIVWGCWAPSRYSSLSLLFLTYSLLMRDALQRGESQDLVRDRYGEPPWELLNEILSVSGLPYRVDAPSEEDLRSSLIKKPFFNLRLFDTEREIEVPLTGLSSGEKVIMSTILWRYSAEHVGRHYRLLLLDEPDAHLHPSLTRQFFDVIHEVFVIRRGVRVIVTTHSPSTVALAPPGSVFEMRRTAKHPGERIVAVERDRAISQLTAGLLVVTERSRFVFVEGKSDPPFYAMLWDILTSASDGGGSPRLPPIPSLVFQSVGSETEQGPGNTGKAQVKRIVQELRKYDLPNPVFGIVDKDDGEATDDGVFAPTERRTVEHYLYDPLVVWASLRSMGKAPLVPGLKLAQGQEHRIRRLQTQDLQRIANAIFDTIALHLSPNKDEKQLRTIRLHNGEELITLDYPVWQLKSPQKSIVGAYHAAFRGLSREVGLPHAYRVVGLVPVDLVELLTRIQA